MQAMLEQMTRLCETCPKLEAGHPTNIYDNIMTHVANALHKVLSTRAEAMVTQVDRDTAYNCMLNALQLEFKEKIQQDDRAFDIFTEQMVNRVLDSFEDSTYTDIEEWHAAWLHGLHEAMKGRIVVYSTENNVKIPVLYAHQDPGPTLSHFRFVCITLV